MLDVKNLRVRFHTRNRDAVGGISFHMDDGEIMGLVGESGSGKSVTAMAVAGLLPKKLCSYSGEIWLNEREMLHVDQKTLSGLQGQDIGVVFQEPMSAMDPLMRVGPQIEEPLKIHSRMTAAERRKMALAAMEAVELPEPESIYQKYPHELSGGMCQRAMIAAAIVTKPKLLLLDEPTTALDVTIQQQIIDLLIKLNAAYGISMLFISHDLKIVKKLCKRVVVMKRGVIVEEGDTERVFYHPQHEYTKKLIAAIPTRERREAL